MGIRTIAEHVESVEVLDELRRIGVDFAQGLVISGPRPMT
jgi:EAL domain-containing protein (putative c-di-GMP-specific phosphodiesterase class I)